MQKAVKGPFVSTLVKEFGMREPIYISLIIGPDNKLYDWDYDRNPDVVIPRAKASVELYPGSTWSVLKLEWVDGAIK